MVLVGGAGTIYGPIVAAIVLTVGTEELAALGNLRYMIVAVLIVLTLRFLPGGIWSLWRMAVPARKEMPKPSTSRSAATAIELREQSR
jgi:ABC-type branched-subunit amino acid transport system permease subunit